MRGICIFAAVFVGACIIAARVTHPGGAHPEPQFRYRYGETSTHGTIAQQNGGTP